ncbi:synaptopodin-2 [Tachyglossus aculeatus]|uniref:synaptopodin-2 n=1 Tax=Tachyglossus aculeatus TaxID=9261 RepID=UPI0018F40A13|nr:synaptopodin-2 [Tachyglossus aculeatus]
MGTLGRVGPGGYLCLSMSGGAPWGFRLQGGQDQQRTLQVAKIRSKSKASGAGLREGDEVIAINGNPCTELTYPQVIELMESITDSLQMLIKRPSSADDETSGAEAESGNPDRLRSEVCLKSSTLQIRPAPQTLYKELLITQVQSGDPSGGPQQEKEIVQSFRIAPRVTDPPQGLLSDKAEEGRPGAVVELQLSLSRDGPEGTGAAGILPGAETRNSPASDPILQQGAGAKIPASPRGEREGPPQWSGRVIQIAGGKEFQGIQGAEAEAPRFSRVEVILDCSAREKAEGTRSQAGKGSVDSQVEGGQSEAPPSLVSFAVSSEGTEQGEDLHSERNHTRPHKHRARHARLRRSESQSEKQVKEAKSKCKSIALLLTAAPNPNSKGVLMFKKRRQRARKYTLVSYGTGELEREEDEEEGDAGAEAFEVTFLGTSESEVDEELPSDTDNEAQIVTFDWDSGLGDIEKKLKSGGDMQTLPDSTGKGAVMFAKRRERMDQITAEQEGPRPGKEREAARSEATRTVTSYQRTEEEVTRSQSFTSKSSVELSRGPSQTVQHNGFAGAAEAQRGAASNRTAKPFPGSAGRAAAAPFSPTRSVASPLSDFPAPPPYSAITPPPDTFPTGAWSPGAGPAPPASWTAPAPWTPYEPSERIASRDERIAVPAKRTGILQEAKRRSGTKPMFTFKDPPKVSPNPELLSLVQNVEGKRGPGAGFESGPEEDYLSLGAEACNFMQTHASKQKTPPPVAPKPSAKASPSQPGAPASPVWAPSAAPSGQPPVFPAAPPAQGPATSPVKVAHPPYRPPSTLNVTGPFRGPQAAVAGQNNPPKTTPSPAAGSAAQVGLAAQLPGMSGKGAQLFAKRQSRMEKYVVDSETVQAHRARAPSPTPSLPASWKYSSNVRAPPPVAYNPIYSPSYPLAAIKSQAPAASKATPKKAKKPLNALEVMKHQPYQLNASLFTFQPPGAKDGPAAKPPAKLDPPPGAKQGLPPRPADAGSPVTYRVSSVYSVPAYGSQPPFHPEAVSPASASPGPVGGPSSPKQESATASYFVAPRPKFSAKRGGVTAQEGGRSFSLPGRPVALVLSPTSPLVFQPDPGPEKTSKRLTPWEAAAKSPLGLVDDAFGPRNIQESIVANVVSAARRKTMPEPPEYWKQRVSYPPQVLKATLGRRQSSSVSAPKSNMTVPLASLPYGSQFSFAYCRTDPNLVALESRSDYCVSLGDCNYNPHPRGWRHQT